MRHRFIARAVVLLPFILGCHEALAQCSLNLADDIISGWGKRNASYTVEDSTLKIRGGAGAINDADSIYIGSIKGCSTLRINVSKISGDFPWGGKVIGFSFSSEKLAPHQWGNEASFPPPRGIAMEAGFVKATLIDNTELVYDIENSAETTHIGAKVFVGNNVALDLQFDTGAGLSTQPVSRSSKRYTARAVSHSDSPASSCSSNCHAPRTAYRQSPFDRATASHGADCPEDGGEMVYNAR